ncbi:endonuclease G [Flavobacterium gillisiae]|uniref:Endonuclease G n=1 Tax=Flavobacterium gillisiae TaxID=150146 RepID=A0A1H4CMB4_9FLAO|nr:DNA/RNA non-specific endonuclease [Flavobacterium gillisiae]SEA61477.1 endonuclease G [Flavobacterium gillisiae]
MKYSQLVIFSMVSLTLLSSCKRDFGPADLRIKNEVGDTLIMKETVAVSNIVFDYLPAASRNEIVKHKYYTLSYNEKAEQAEWLAYELKKEYVTKSDFKRPYFIEDPKVKTTSADWRNYKDSGYDKGHLCPAGDMQFDKSAYNDTFYTSNISPQNHDFNAGFWNRLEQKIRYWAVRYDGVYVVTGGVFKNSTKTIGREKVIVPDSFYKIVLNRTNDNYKMIAFLVPNEPSEKPLYSFVVSVDRIEELTGIDFFPKLDDKLENSLEKNTDYSAWIFN